MISCLSGLGAMVSADLRTAVLGHGFALTYKRALSLLLLDLHHSLRQSVCVAERSRSDEHFFLSLFQRLSEIHHNAMQCFFLLKRI